MNITSAPAWVVFEKRGLTDKGGYYLSVCPSHNDDKKSLGLKVADDGKILVHCYAGCTTQKVCDTLGIELKFLWPTQEGRKPSESANVIAEYDYKDESGKILYQVQRTDPKGFRQRRKTDTGWEWKLGDVRRVLYRLPELIASAPRPIVIVEGEKDVEAVRKLGFIATTCAGGVEGWRPEYAQSIGDRTCVVIPDNDPPGEEFAAVIATWIPNALLIRLPGVPLKGDVSDWIAMGNGKKEFISHVHKCALGGIARSSRIYHSLGGK